MSDRATAGFVHLCDHSGCGRWGSYGYGVALRKGVAGRWYCAVHRPDARRPPPRQAATPAPPMGARQTNLFVPRPGAKREDTR